jgi:hypothetical protein
VKKSFQRVCPSTYANFPRRRYKFIKTPLFIFESQADSVNLAGHNSVPSDLGGNPISAPLMEYLAGWHRNMSTCLAEITNRAPGVPSPHGVIGLHQAGRHGDPGTVNPADGNATLGVFNPSCYIHTGFTNDITIDGVNYKEAFRNFFYGTGVKVAPSAGPGGPGAPTILFDDCGELCNPTCDPLVPPPPPLRKMCLLREIFGSD